MDDPRQKSIYFYRYINSCICVTKLKVRKKINNIDINGKYINHIDFIDFIRYYAYLIKSTLVSVSYFENVVMQLMIESC